MPDIRTWHALNITLVYLNFQTRDRLSESHMWVSIIYRPQTSPFTRVQRWSCALVYICLTMIANAMFYKTEADYETPPLIQAGPFRFTAQQVRILVKLKADPSCLNTICLTLSLIKAISNLYKIHYILYVYMYK